MKIHHLNCGTLCPLCRRLVNGDGSYFERGRLVCHSLLIERRNGELVLVDGGFGLEDCADAARFPALWRFQAAPRFLPEETAVHQIKQLGFDPAMVKDIILTHLDRDHCGAIEDFPDAAIHVSATEFGSAFKQSPPLREGRLVRIQFESHRNFSPHDVGEEEWFGFPSASPLGDDVAIRLVSLPGHTHGHCGVAVQKRDDNWLLHAGDAFYSAAQIADPPTRLPRGLASFERRATTNREVWFDTLERLRRLAIERPDVDIFCSHDVTAFERLSGQTVVAAGR